MLPGVDDGPSTWDEALAMARTAVDDGVRAVVATPHQLGNYRHNDAQAVQQAVARFQQRLDQEGIGLHVFAGADVRIEPELVPKLRAGEVLPLAGSRYVLLELPHEIYLPLDRLLAELKTAGYVGILSHPERNLGIMRQPEVLDRLLEAGCLMQLTAGSLTGTFGPQVQGFAERLVRLGYVHFIATDAHGSRLRRPLLGRGWASAAQLVGSDAACNLCAHNPARVIRGQTVQPGRLTTATRARRPWWSWRRAS